MWYFLRIFNCKNLKLKIQIGEWTRPKYQLRFSSLFRVQLRSAFFCRTSTWFGDGLAKNGGESTNDNLVVTIAVGWRISVARALSYWLWSTTWSSALALKVDEKSLDSYVHVWRWLDAHICIWCSTCTDGI